MQNSLYNAIKSISQLNVVYNKAENGIPCCHVSRLIDFETDSSLCRHNKSVNDKQSSTTDSRDCLGPVFNRT